MWKCGSSFVLEKPWPFHKYSVLWLHGDFYSNKQLMYFHFNHTILLLARVTRCFFHVTVLLVLLFNWQSLGVLFWVYPRTLATYPNMMWVWSFLINVSYSIISQLWVLQCTAKIGPLKAFWLALVGWRLVNLELHVTLMLYGYQLGSSGSLTIIVIINLSSFWP